MELSRLQYAQKYIHRGVVSQPLYDYEFNNRGPVTYTYTGDVIEGEIPMEPKPDKPNQGGGGDKDPFNGHEYVDLGLPSGTLWATMNIGATIPEEVGDHFAWGETEVKDSYTRENYAFYNPEDYRNCTKYNSTDHLEVLELTDDAAHVNWGGDWVIPTSDQIEELVNECVWTWTEHNDIHYFTITGPNGNNIIYPLEENGAGHCWASAVYDSTSAVVLNVSPTTPQQSHHNYRFEGMNVRPVINIPSNEPNAMYKPRYMILSGTGGNQWNITWNREAEKYECELGIGFTGDIDIYMDQLMSSYEDVRSVVFSNEVGVTINEQQAVSNFFNQGRLFIVASVVDTEGYGEKSFDTTVTFKDGSSWTLTISWTQEAVA